VGRLLGSILGEIFFRLVRVRREVTLAQLKSSFPEMSPGERTKVGLSCYRNFVFNAVDLLHLHGRGIAEIARYFSVSGLHLLDKALAGGRGLVIVSFHFGNWELAGSYISGLGYPLNVVVQRIHNPFIDKMATELRLGVGMKIIPRDRALRGSLNALQRNEIVILMADQDARDSGVFVPFFGRYASTPRGPAVIALRRDVPAVMVFVVRRRDGTFEVTFEPIPHGRSGDLERDIEEFTGAFTSRLEAYVRKYPDQWLWLHRRWKTVKPGAD